MDLIKIYNRDRYPDMQFKEMLRTVLGHGRWNKAQAGEDLETKSYFGYTMRFKVADGAPVVTEKTVAPDWKKTPQPWKQCIGEIFAFINGARTTKELESFGCNFWKYWVTEDKCKKRLLESGDLGFGSYGHAFHDFPMTEGAASSTGQVTEGVNQFQNVLEQMRELPHLKTHEISPWVPPYVYRGKGKTQRVVVCPCHGWLHFDIDSENRLTLHHRQRSGDILVGVPLNMIQYFSLLLAVAHVLKLTPYEYVHHIVDAHIYSNQVEEAHELLERPTFPKPMILLDNPPDDLFDFRAEHFKLEEYVAGEYMKIPFAV